MLPLQHLKPNDWTTEVALVVILYTVLATVYQHFKKHEDYPEGVKGAMRETLDALVMIASIWVLQVAMHFTIGENYVAAGVEIHAVLDCGHLAVAIRWLTKCLLRYLK